MSAQAPMLKSYEFRREREATWTELEQLIELVNKRGIQALTAQQLARLPHLYRATLSSLSVARTISLDRNVVEYLENLATRAYFCVYGTKRHLRAAVWEFLAWRFPAAVRRFKWPIVMSAALLILGVVAGFLITVGNEDRFYTFVSEDYAGGRGPHASTAELKQVLYDEHDFGDVLGTFAASLFTHNARIGILCFALGFLIGLPTMLLLFTNGLILGAFAALYHGRGLSVDLWGWLLPHGVTELGAVVLCGGAGLVLAQALVFPGRDTRLRSIAERGRGAGTVVIGSVVMFFIAGLIEGLFRQLVTHVPTRYAVATATVVLWALYFGFAGRARASAEDDG